MGPIRAVKRGFAQYAERASPRIGPGPLSLFEPFPGDNSVMSGVFVTEVMGDDTGFELVTSCV